MAHQQVVFDEFFPAPRAKVFAYFADHVKFGRIFGGQFSRIRDGDDPADPDGLHSVRHIKSAGLSFEETIVAYRPPELIEYTVSKGSPIRNHLGHIEFHEVSGGTRVHYTIRFEPKIPFTGGLIAGVIKSGWKKGVHRVMEGL